MAATAFLWAWSLSGESLWLDELHTSWVIAAGWDQILPRAQAGNQSPAYFYALHFCDQVIGHVESGLVSREVALRLPSLVAWGLAAGIFVWWAASLSTHLCLTCANLEAHNLPDRPSRNDPESAWRSSGGRASSLGLAAACGVWLLVDRLQCFYATEARGYSIVQSLGLVAWLLVAWAVAGRRRWIAWSGWNFLAPLMMHLHITSSLVVFCQWMTLGITSTRDRCGRRVYLLSSIWLGLNAWSVLRPMGGIWNRRDQWLAFAGDWSLVSVISQFPVLAGLVPLALFVATRPRRKTSGSRPEYSVWLWAVAALGPISLAWLLTAVGGIPIFHFRFMIGSAIPLYLLAAVLVTRIPGIAGRWLSVSGLFLWLVVFQGTAGHWYQMLSGRLAPNHAEGLATSLMGHLRGEGWREAVAHVAERIELDSDLIACSSGLIEARSLQPPLTETQNEYLTFPLRGIYLTAGRQEPEYLLGLVGSSRLWRQQLWEQSEKHVDLKTVWIIHRGTTASLNQRLARAGLLEPIGWTESQQFGGVSVACGQFKKSD
jgi:hypothetical protein